MTNIRDKMIVERMHELDEMAYGLANAVNRLHATGTGLSSAANSMKSAYGLKPDAQVEPLPFLKDGVLQLHLVDEENQFLETYDVDVRSGVDSVADVINRLNATVGNPDLLRASLEEDGSVQIQTGEGRRFIFGEDTSDFTVVMGFNNFFDTLKGAEDIQLNDRVKKNPGAISTGKDLVPGDNQVALDIARLQGKPTLRDGTVTFDEFYNSILADVGLRIQRNNLDKEHQDQLIDQFQQIRSSISSVNVDEEVTNMMQQQKAYEASARYVNTVSEMMDTLIRM